MEFQQRLFDLRRKSGLSQEELANLVGVSRQAVQKWEAGTSKPDIENLSALANYFQVTLDYLIQGKVSAPSPQEPTVVHHHYRRWQYEYKSDRTLWGLPLVHINCGPGICRAKGIIAIGNIATGFVALGGIAFGAVSAGGAALGLLALGGLAVGGLVIGGLGIGLVALAGIALGWLTFGGVSFGVYAVGGVSMGSKIAIGGVASAPVAIGAAADGAQSFLVPKVGMDEIQRLAAQQAVRHAAPGWLSKLLCRFL